MKELFFPPCSFESKTNQRHSWTSLIRLWFEIDTSLIPVCIECTSAIHWVFPYYPRNSSLTNLKVNPRQDKTFIPQKHIKKIPIFALNFTSKIKLWGRLFWNIFLLFAPCFYLSPAGKFLRISRMTRRITRIASVGSRPIKRAWTKRSIFFTWCLLAFGIIPTASGKYNITWTYSTQNSVKW